MSKQHNLRIQDYTLDELLGLFDLTSRKITMEQVKTAKKRVLMLHPDKSRLGPEYFLFYKQALEMLVQIYEQHNKQNQTVTTENTTYRPMDSDSKSIGKQVNQTIQKMSAKDFQTKFNTLFEQNQMGKQVDSKQYEWFSKDDTAYQAPENVSASTLGQRMEELKEKQSGMIKYRGVQDFDATRSTTANVFGDEDDEDARRDGYISSDPFSKLKFDDLRKVHKDETVLSVSERDFHKMKTYQSVDELNRARSGQSIKPLDKSAAEDILQQREIQMRDQMMQREYRSKIQTQDYQEKNKAVLANFLRLGNG